MLIFHIATFTPRSLRRSAAFCFHFFFVCSSCLTTTVTAFIYARERTRVRESEPLNMDARAEDPLWTSEL